MKTGHLALVLLATLVLALIPLWAVPAPEVRGQVTVGIMMRDPTSFEPGSFPVMPGDSVNLTITNSGVQPHTFTLFNDTDADVPVSPFSALETYAAGTPKLVDITLSGGQVQSTSFTAPLTEGTYTYVCMISGHAALGMVGTMIVTSTPEGDGAVDPLLLGIVVAIAVIVIAVATVFLLRRRR